MIILDAEVNIIATTVTIYFVSHNNDYNDYSYLLEIILATSPTSSVN